MFKTLTDTFEKWWAKTPAFLFSLLEAALIVVLGILLVRLGRRLIRKTYASYSRKRSLNTRGETVQKLFLSLFNTVMYFAIVLSALSVLGVDVGALLALAGFSGFALAFGCQTLIKDVISGMFLWIEGSCNVGDVVTVAGQTGTVESIALRTTVLRSTNGSLYTVKALYG